MCQYVCSSTGLGGKLLPRSSCNTRLNTLVYYKQFRNIINKVSSKMEYVLCNSLVDSPGFKAKREPVKKFTREIFNLCILLLLSKKYYNHKYSDVTSPAVKSLM